MPLGLGVYLNQCMEFLFYLHDNGGLSNDASFHLNLTFIRLQTNNPKSNRHRFCEATEVDRRFPWMSVRVINNARAEYNRQLGEKDEVYLASVLDIAMIVK